MEKKSSNLEVISLPEIKEQQLAFYPRDCELKKNLPRCIKEDNIRVFKKVVMQELPAFEGYPSLNAWVKFDENYPESKEILVNCIQEALRILAQSKIATQVMQKIAQETTAIKIVFEAGNVAYRSRNMKKLPIAECLIQPKQTQEDYHIAIRYGTNNPRFMAELILHECIHYLHIKNIHPLAYTYKPLTEDILKFYKDGDKVAQVFKDLGSFGAMDMLMLIFFDELFTKTITDAYNYEMYGTCANFLMPYIDALLAKDVPEKGNDRIAHICRVLLQMIISFIEPYRITEIEHVSATNTLINTEFYKKCNEDYNEIFTEITISALNNTLGYYLKNHRGIVDFFGDEVDNILKAFMKMDFPFFSDEDFEIFDMEENMGYILVDVRAKVIEFVKKNIKNTTDTVFITVFLKAIEYSPIYQKLASKWRKDKK